jgi:hypothetical protein
MALFSHGQMKFIAVAQHQQKRWPNEEKWRRGIDNRAGQMDGMGVRH